MSRDPDDIQGILNTLLVPMEPPNRSQWKKLELAMKFIKLSKQSVAGTKKVTKQEWNVGFLTIKRQIFPINYVREEDGRKSLETFIFLIFHSICICCSGRSH